MSDGNKRMYSHTPADLWNDFLTHQLRVLLYAEPLLKLTLRDEHRAAELRHYDSLSLALKLFDSIIEHTGLEQEIDHNTALQILLPLLEAMDQAAGLEVNRTRELQMAERVLAVLRNDEDGQRPFKITYTDFDKNQVVERVLSVRLIEERYHTDGRIILRLSNELTNLLLNALSTDIEDAQAAAEAIVQSQLARGRLHEAVNSAREALSLESEEIGHLAEIIALVEDCRQRHMELQQHLLRARLTFLDEQERQAFTLLMQTSLPHLLSDVLEPLLQAPRVLAEHAIVDMLPFCLGVRIPRVFSLAHAIQRQLQPRREPRPDSVPEEPRELVSVSNDQPYYSPEHTHRAKTYLQAIEKPVRLHELLQRALHADEAQQTVELLAFLVLRQFDPEEKNEYTFDVFKTDGEQFSLGHLTGDNPLLCPQEDSHV